MAVTPGAPLTRPLRAEYLLCERIQLQMALQNEHIPGRLHLRIRGHVNPSSYNPDLGHT